MSFHFKRIRFKDWLVYSGEHEMKFPAFKTGRNLVVFNGSNGFGKTSILRALAFVFDGRVRKSELRDDLWSHGARDAGQGSLEVAIEFQHGEKTCKIVRGADFRPWGDGMSVTPWVRLFEDRAEVTDQVEDKIEQMLPRECLEFIFFDGADISRYARKQHDAGVRDAIEKVLGIPAVRNLRDDLEALVGLLENEQQKLLGESRQAEHLLAEIESLKDHEAGYRSRKDDLLEKKLSLEATKNDLQRESEGIQTIERERQELKSKRSRRAELNERRDEYSTHIADFVARAPLRMLEDPLAQIVEELRAEVEPSPRKEDHLSLEQILKRLLGETDCICGREIDDQVRRRFREDLDRIGQQLAGSRSRTPSRSADLLDLSALLKSIQSSRLDPEELIDKRAAVDRQLEELDTDIGRLERALEGHDDVKVNELFQQIGQVAKQIAETEAGLRTVDANLQQTQGDLQKKQRELDQLGAGNEQARGVTRTLEETRRLHAAVADLVERLVESKRHAIEATASEVFGQITNKPEEYDCLRVRPDYTIEVVRKDGSVVENQRLSAGEKEVVAYSFITALNLSSEDPAPFVMDTPFGHLDAAHRAGLLRSLPKLKVQAILLATDRDLPAQERDAIDGCIATEFTLRRDQRRAMTTIEEA